MKSVFTLCSLLLSASAAAITPFQVKQPTDAYLFPQSIVKKRQTCVIASGNQPCAYALNRAVENGSMDLPMSLEPIADTNALAKPMGSLRHDRRSAQKLN